MVLREKGVLAWEKPLGFANCVQKYHPTQTPKPVHELYRKPKSHH